MRLKSRFEDSLLKSKVNVVGTQPLSSHGNQFMDPRLQFINALCGSGLDNIARKNSIIGDPAPAVFRVSRDVNALGISISVTQGYGGEIQFSCPRNDSNTLLLSVLPPYSSYGSSIPEGKIYDYTGNIEAANERLVEWLAEVAPEYSAEIGAMLDKIENPQRGPMMVIERAQP